MRADFDDRGITFREYPFPPASVRRDRHLPWAQVRDVDPDAAPPEVRTVDGETLFVDARQAADLWTACAAAGRPIVHRIDVWDLLLEPYLDTSFDAEDRERTLTTLERCGISRRESSEIRRRVGGTMLAYNSVLWDWVHLGLYDLLTVTRRAPTLLTLRHRLSSRRYATFYRWAMEIADRGVVRSGLAPDTDALMNAIHRDADELCSGLHHDSLNYSVSLRCFPAAGAADASIAEIARRALGETATLGAEPTPSALDTLLAELEHGVRYEGDAGSHPSPDFPSSPECDHLLESIGRRLREGLADTDAIHEVWFSEGHPFYPVWWDFAFVIVKPPDAFVLVGSSSD